jgi:hypothetical protein
MSLTFRISLFFALAILIVGCTTSRTATSASPGGTKGASLTTEEALEIMRRVEREPLSAEAPELRRTALEWIVSSKDLGDLSIETSYLRELENSTWPFKGEMVIQFLFGSAIWRMTGDSLRSDPLAQAEAGLRSVLAAYKNMLAADAKLREPSLDDLDEVRRLGKLRSYIRDIDSKRP